MRNRKREIDSAARLISIDHKEILIMSRVQGGHISNAEVARRMGLGEETVARYQRYPKDGEQDFSLPAYRIPAWNQAVGNHVVSEWAAERDGGLYVRVDGESDRDTNVVAQIGKVNREMNEVTTCLLDDLADDNRLDERELDRLLKEMLDTRKALDEAILAVQRKTTTGRA